MTTTYMLDYDLRQKIPSLSTNPREIFFGLPHRQDYFIDRPRVLTDIVYAWGFCEFAKSEYHGEICFSSSNAPISGPFSFITKDGNLTDMREVVKYPDDVVYGSVIDGPSHSVVLSGYVFDQDSEMRDVKVYLDQDRKVFVDFLDESNIYSLSDARMAVPIGRGDVYIFKVKIVPLLETEHYKGFDSDYYQLDYYITTYPLPADDIISESQNLFRDDPCSFKVIPCAGGDVRIPNYLRPLFHDDNPVFRVGDHEPEDFCVIDSSSMKLIIGWMLDLVMWKKLPSFQTYQDQWCNFDDWSFIADYLSIPYFHKLFCDIHDKISRDC